MRRALWLVGIHARGACVELGATLDTHPIQNHVVAVVVLARRTLGTKFLFALTTERTCVVAHRVGGMNRSKVLGTACTHCHCTSIPCERSREKLHTLRRTSRSHLLKEEEEEEKMTC